MKRQAGWSTAGIKIAGINTNNLRYADDTSLMAESEEELKSLLMKVKKESEKVGLKLNSHKTKIMASGPITSRQIDGETMETVTDFIFLGSKITADGDCSHEIKELLLLGKKKNYDQPRQHIKKQRHHFADKCQSSQSCGFSSSHVQIRELDYKESWAPKNWFFWNVVLEKTLERVPWTARRSNQSILKEISPEYSLEWLMLKLMLHTMATWCEELAHWERFWCWERLKVGGEGDDRGWDGWMASPTRWTCVWVGDGQGSLVCCYPWGHKESERTEWLNWLTDWYDGILLCHKRRK